MDQPDEIVQRRRNALGLCTKEVCSGLFVSGRDEQSLRDSDLAVLCAHFAGGVLHPGEIGFTVDRERATVIGELPDGTRRYAACSGEGGVALVDRLPDRPGSPCPVRKFDDRSWPDGDAFEPGPAYRPLRAAVRAHLAATGGRGVAVVHRGRLVAEEFAPGFSALTPTRGWSTAKTLTSLIVGRLHGLGVVDAWAPAGIAAWQHPGDPRSRIRMVDLLRLQSGLSMPRAADGSPAMLTDADGYFAAYCRPVSAARMVSEVDMDTAGIFSYQSIDFLAAAVALCRVAKRARSDSAPARTGSPRPETRTSTPAPGPVLAGALPGIGLRHSVVDTDAEGTPLLCGSWYTTPADLARLGQLVLGHGRLGGRRVLPESWVDVMRAESPATAEGCFTGPEAFRHPYGAGLWLNRDGHLPAVPRLTSYALGSLGQAVFVLDEHDLVIARTALEPKPDHAALISAVLAALPVM